VAATDNQTIPKPSAPPASSTPAPRKQRGNAEYPYLFRLVHWLLAGSLIVLILTGFSLHAIARPAWSVFLGVLPDWFWPGRVNLWHFVAALVFFPAVAGACIAGQSRGFWSRATHALLLGGGLLTAITGLVMLYRWGPPGLYRVSVFLHVGFGMVLLPIVLVWHAVAGLTRYRGYLVAAFHPWRGARWGQLLGFVPVVVVTWWLMFDCWPLGPRAHTLHAKRIDRVKRETAELPDLPWSKAEPLSMWLANGAGCVAGQTQVTLRALHDGEELYVLAEWLDPREDRQDMPWKKTKDGWERLVTNPDDESVHYEDKFSLIFPAEPDWRFDRFGCALYCHAGGEGHFYGYKAASRTVDVWHWKSTRTDPVGQCDDKYWSLVDPDSKDAGRFGDPKDSGGYKKNASEDGTHPAWLPDEMSAVFHGIIPTEHAVDYSEQLAAQIPPDTIIPGIVASAAVGDRGDVGCVSFHEQQPEGRWRLYLRRRLDTGSDKDCRFDPGGRYPFGCAVFECTSKRHAYELVTYWLELEP